jgi:hypothetical protein
MKSRGSGKSRGNGNSGQQLVEMGSVPCAGHIARIFGKSVLLRFSLGYRLREERRGSNFDVIKWI